MATDTVMQLDIFGGEQPHASVVVTNRLTPNQRAIMWWRRERGSIRSVEAGTIVHAARSPFGCTHPSGSGAGCCRYAATDGSDALGRLARRGFLTRVARGIWQ